MSCGCATAGRSAIPSANGCGCAKGSARVERLLGELLDVMRPSNVRKLPARIEAFAFAATGATAFPSEILPRIRGRWIYLVALDGDGYVSEKDSGSAATRRGLPVIAGGDEKEYEVSLNGTPYVTGDGTNAGTMVVLWDDGPDSRAEGCR